MPPTFTGRSDDPHDSGRRGVSVGVLLIFLALVPLVGAAWFANRELEKADEVRATLAAVDSASERLFLLTELRATLLDESNWVNAYDGVVEFGIPIDTVADLTGIDMEAEVADAISRTDRLVSDLALDPVSIEEIRALPYLPEDELTPLYLAIERELFEESEAIYRNLTDIGGEVRNGDDLIEGLRVLEAAIDARQAIARQVTSYYSARFAPFSLASFSAAAVIEFSALYDAAMQELESRASATSETGQQLELVLASEARGVFQTELGTIVDDAFVAGIGSDVTAAAILGDIDAIVASFRAATTTSAEHLELVRAAGADVVAAANGLTDAADEARRSATTTIVVVTATSLVFAVVLTRVIGRPLRSLADKAQELQGGDTSQHVKVKGPSEVRRAARAINEAVGHLELAERQAHALAEGDLDHAALNEAAPGALGASLQDAVRTLARSLSEREEFRTKLAHEAAHDGLTQLPNRTASLTRLQQGLARITRTDASLAVLFLDLDGFKDVNDSLGHQAGDEVLRRTAQRLVAELREGDHVGRLGGDEFLVIAEPVGGVHEAVGLAHRLLAAVSEPMNIGGSTARVGVSIGIAMATDASLSADELLRDADIAVYQAKALGRGRVQICDERLRSEVLEQTQFEQALRGALEREELELHYQPIIDPDDDRLCSLEALVRWSRPGHGLLDGDAIVPPAARSDLIVSVDQWVVGRVAQQLQEWTDHPQLGRVPVALNVSGRFLDSDGFVDAVLTPLTAHGIDPRRLVLEISENALLDDLERASDRLEQVRRRGVQVAIDDFGTGYTSLASLRTLPIDILKIDRSFTAGIGTSVDDESLVKLIIDTGHLLGVNITAEGIETPQQAATLAQLGSDDQQGFFFSRPVPPDELARRFENVRSAGPT